MAGDALVGEAVGGLRSAGLAGAVVAARRAAAAASPMPLSLAISLSWWLAAAVVAERAGVPLGAAGAVGGVTVPPVGAVVGVTVPRVGVVVGVTVPPVGVVVTVGPPATAAGIPRAMALPMPIGAVALAWLGPATALVPASASRGSLGSVSALAPAWFGPALGASPEGF